MGRTGVRAVLAGLALVLLAASRLASGLNLQDAGRPALLVVISVDQMRADYLSRFQEHYTGGLKWLYENGVVFENALHTHALTETGPGHSTILTGMTPGHTGIVANQWYDRDRRIPVYCVEDLESPILEDSKADGRSPKNLKALTVGDRLKAVSPQSKVISVSGKDRAAILMGGQHADHAYWYNAATGKLVTSVYYQKRYPAWIDALNRRRIPASYFGKMWDYLRPGDRFYSLFGDDDVAAEDDIDPRFPHLFGRSLFVPVTALYSTFTQTPFLDDLILTTAREAIRAERLGARGQTDILAIGLSSTDYVGHVYGPGSHEMADQLLRLDQSLGAFFKDLDSQVGLGRVAIVMTGDHGVLPLRNQAAGANARSARLAKEEVLAFQGLNEALSKKFGAQESWLSFYADGDLYLNYAPIVRHSLRRSDVESAVKEFLRGRRGIAAVYSRSDMDKALKAPDEYLNFFRNGFHPEISGDVEILFSEFLIPVMEPRGTTHGSPYRYDRWVPLVFYGAGWKPQRVVEEVHIVDVAPTLIEALKLPAAEELDGVSRLSLLQ